MAIFDLLKRDAGRFNLPGTRPLNRAMRRYLPTGLYTRSLLIVILPMLLLQTVVAAVFMERHWRLVTERLSEGTVAISPALSRSSRPIRRTAITTRSPRLPMTR